MAGRLSPVPSGPARLGGDVEQQEERQLVQETSLPNVPQYSFPGGKFHVCHVWCAGGPMRLSDDMNEGKVS